MERSEKTASPARAAHVGHAKALIPVLQEILAGEMSPEAAREQIRALASIAGPASDSVLRQAANRFGGRLDADLLEALARTRGPAAIPIIGGEEWEATVSPRLRAELLLIAARGDTGSLEAPFHVLLDRKDAAATWKSLLRGAYARRHDLPIVVMLRGLRSRAPEIAGVTAWELAKRNVTKGAAAAELFSQPWKAPDGADLDTSFAFELLSRSMEGRRESHPVWLQSLETPQKSFADELGPRSPLVRLLDSTERDAVRRRRERRSPNRKSKLADWETGPARQATSSQEQPPVLRVVSNLPHGLVLDTLAVSGCKPKKKEAFGAAQVHYNVEGRPLRVNKIETDANERCESAAAALFLMTLASRTHLPTGFRPQILLAFTDPECIQNLDEPGVSELPRDEHEADVIRVADKVRPPQLVRKVDPIYPEKSRQEGREGAVILEAVISRDGCVSEIETMRGVDPELDYAAARAVSQWRYQPATLGGKPVRVYLTVTVTFNLRR